MKRVLLNTNGYHPMGKPSPLVATIHLAKSTVLLLLLSTEQEPKDARLAGRSTLTVRWNTTARISVYELMKKIVGTSVPYLV